MRRTDRLFEILQLFRGGRLLLGREIAERLEVSLRTVYRDIETLVASGVPIEGERGVGYLLREPIFLPPLTLTPEELRALHLGVEVIRQTGDADLAAAAEHLVGKVGAVLPSDRCALQPLRDLAVYASVAAPPRGHLGSLRRAVSNRLVVQIDYLSLDGQRTQRRIRPLQTEFWGRIWTCPAWCELRSAFRVFRVDRIETCLDTGDVFALDPGRTYADYLKSIRVRPDGET
ncbi:YafY family protein [Brevundimonas sp.]|jgi:predicted DNA-binding transcriptional regulator YafY|uniref:helix-turn-helix transcriptional regulator n=1 Tax=Brevundimonas sp. TaxID=1871086 RepID=UPI002E14247D|nr:YafY family protein [Brevundimonas sp.]